MASETELYLIRSEDEYFLARNDYTLSTDARIQKISGIIGKTFFHSVIAHTYYSIFYAAKAYLYSKGVKTKAPEEHKKTYDEFKKMVKAGIISEELLLLYEDAIIKAETLLDIFFREKRKRGMFTYNMKSEANKPYAEESLKNAKRFVTTINKLLKKN